MINQPLYCTVFNTQIGNFSGFKVRVAEAKHYIWDLKQTKTLISRQLAIRLRATIQELQQSQMTVQIVLNPDPVSFETKIDRGEIPAIPKWATLIVVIKPEAEMRIFDLIIGSDVEFKPKASPELWQKHIEDYKKNKKMSKDISNNF